MNTASRRLGTAPDAPPPEPLPEPPNRAGHILALDGLRGVAILMVLVGHFYLKPLVSESYPTLTNIYGRIANSGGYGVDLFFVLSGFLITGILLETRRTPGFFKKFYMRRLLRIFPLYYAALLGVLVLLPLAVPPDSGAQAIRTAQGWLWTYLVNWPTAPWVWDSSSQYLLGHFWSLCVEEHFYIFWPALVAFLSPRTLFKTCLALVATGALSRALTLILGPDTPTLLQWNTLHNLDGLALGSAIAACYRDRSLVDFLPRGRTLARGLWVTGILVSAYVWLPRKWNHPAFGVASETVFALFFALALIAIIELREGSRWRRVFESPFLVSLGKYSYGLYVIHGIARPALASLFDFRSLPTGYGLPWLYQLVFYVIAVGFCFALAYASYHLFEKRFLSLKRHFSYA